MHVRRFDFDPIGFRNLRNIQRALAQAESEDRPDVVVTSTGPSYFHSRAPQIQGFNLPLYLYPESPYLDRLNLYRWIRFHSRKRIQLHYLQRDADAFLVQTDDVGARVRELMQTNAVFTATNTYNHHFSDPMSFPDKLPPRQPGRFRLLTVSSWYPHKDLELIPKVQAELHRRGIQNVDFVLTLTEEGYRQMVERSGVTPSMNEFDELDPASRMGSDIPGIFNVGPVPIAECPSLYAECDAMFLPTLAECFSASYPEAMVMGKPILTTDLGFARGICGDAALYFGAGNVMHAADHIQFLLSHPGEGERLIRAGRERLKTFDSPAQRADKVLNACRQVTQGVRVWEQVA